MLKYVYSFKEGNKDMRELLGGKGANLAEMKSIGLPVPSGFTITTEACNKYYNDGMVISDDIKEEIISNIHLLEEETGKILGDKNNPLLVSVRSGSRASMPGMMDTVLNLGMNDEVAESLSNRTQNRRFVYDSYRRFIMMFADVVKGYPKSSFERIIDEYKEKENVKLDIELNADDMYEITLKFKELYKKLSNNDFPQDPNQQLIEAITAVFRSWNNERAILYRKLNDIPSTWGTAVNIQEMVYGNISSNSGTGVAFTRNPATGENELYGEYLINAQGEDVVAGVRTPSSINKLKEEMPEIYEQFYNISKKLEHHYKDMQDMEFTIENGKLYILQTRNGKRTGQAAVKIAVDLVKEGLITKEEALMKVEPKLLEQLLHKTFDKDSLKNSVKLAMGLAASPGAAYGKIYFNAKDLINASKNNEDTILVRLETSPEDIEGMNYANGILTIRGGMTSHAAVVARGMGKCCVSGCGELKIDEQEKTLTTNQGKIFEEGDYLSLDGTSGIVYEGVIKTVDPEISEEFKIFMNWVDEIKEMGVRANADSPKDAIEAIKFGAEGIGLCRTEHMFFEKDRIFAIREMIVAYNEEERKKALDKLLPFQRKDFEEMFTVLAGKPITIRYLDPPLHEFLPTKEEEINKLAEDLEIDVNKLKSRIISLKEFNPMMGHRGCRLAITYPEIAVMQTKAIIEAAINVYEKNINVDLEIMIPLVGIVEEIKYIKDIIDKTAKSIMDERNVHINYKVGTMIEVPRATLIADEIAKYASFFSFGTNDLTQMTFGYSRDDASKFLNDYYNKKILEFDPFVKLDVDGVGRLIQIAIKLAKMERKDIKLGVCGEQGGDPASVSFFHKVGLDYVSCSPYRILMARLSSAQASILENRN